MPSSKETLQNCRTFVPSRRPDMDAVKQGFMAKDVVEKLNRIEKLSNRVRQALTQEGGLNCNCFVPGTNRHHGRM